MSKLGAYPGDPPEGNDLISPEEEKVWEILEAAGIADEVNEKVMVIVRELAIKAAHEYVCQICERRAIERETEDIKMAGVMKDPVDYSLYECPYAHLEKDCGHELHGPEGYEDAYGVWCACGFRGPAFYLDPGDLKLKKKDNAATPQDGIKPAPNPPPRGVKETTNARD